MESVKTVKVNGNLSESVGISTICKNQQDLVESVKWSKSVESCKINEISKGLQVRKSM